MIQQKHILFIFLITFVLSFSAIGEVLYQQDSLELELETSGDFNLEATGSNAKIKDVEAQLLLFPQENFRQQRLTLDSAGVPMGNAIDFSWSDGAIEEKKYGFISTVKTNNQRRQVKNKISFPIQNVEGLEEYLEATTAIDSTNPMIIAQATQLAQGEDDLFKVVFKLASWVEENIEYDLNTLTASASQKASWVLENREGVCDEMTSLFVAMARSLGIPARFASGISYTTSPLFDYNWQPHGWAEVYFPSVGWVGFDITFNQYGYVDVTHIKLRDGFDPTEPGTKFSWTANNVDLRPGEIDFRVNVKKQGNFVPEEIQLSQEILSSKVGIGSYNIIKGIVENTADYYTATALNLATPSEVEIIGRNRRNILLAPKEVRETFWIVKIPSNLDGSYIYTFPTLLFSEKNITITDSFVVEQGAATYSKEEIEALTIVDEEKQYSQRITFNCDEIPKVKLNEQKDVSCSLKNSGNVNLENLELCFESDCQTISLPINQEKEHTLQLTTSQVGWSSVIVTAQNDLVELRESIEYQVIDVAQIMPKVEGQRDFLFGEDGSFTLTLTKTSFDSPREVLVRIKGPSFGNEWRTPLLERDQSIEVPLDTSKLGFSNTFDIEIKWVDSSGEEHMASAKHVVKINATSFGNRFRMILNSVLGFLSF